MRYLLLCVAGLLGLLTQPVMACGPEVHIQFVEASPDRFRITFVRGPKLQLVGLTIKLDGSVAGVVFDDYDGLSMQGPQPNAAGVTVRSVTYDPAGNAIATLTFDGFVEKRVFDFVSDLDDRGLGVDPDQNHIYDGELVGASAVATLVSDKGRRIEVSGKFDSKGRALLGERACV